MYNETLKFFKQNRIDNKPILTDAKQIRTYHLKQVRNKLIDKSVLNEYDFKTKINTHILDQSIKDACSAYKSCLSNLKNKHIKYFRLRYLKLTKKHKIITIEKILLSTDKKTFCSTIFPNGIKLENDYKLSKINSDFNPLPLPARRE